MQKIIISLFFLLLAGPLAADPLADGVAAYRSADYAAALRLWQPLAEAGNHDAQYNLGLLYQHGRGTDKDLRQAHEWYTRSANQGNPDAMYNLGVMYITGEGVFPSSRQAADLFAHAARQDHVPALYNLAVMYAYGMGLAQDADKAVELWTHAAGLGSAEARAALAQAYAQGLGGLPANATEAARWQAPQP